jgi:hypothetical protein
MSGNKAMAVPFRVSQRTEKSAESDERREANIARRERVDQA